MQISHPSYVSLNTLVFWPTVLETLESQFYWEIFISFHTSALQTSLKYKMMKLPLSSFYPWKEIFFSPPQQASLHHSGPASLMATSWAKLIYTWTRQSREEERFTHSADMTTLPFCKWTLFDSSSHCVSSPPSRSPFCLSPFPSHAFQH